MSFMFKVKLIYYFFVSAKYCITEEFIFIEIFAEVNSEVYQLTHDFILNSIPETFKTLNFTYEYLQSY